MGKIDFDVAWSLLNTAERAERLIPQGFASLDLEFTEGDRADWYLVQTYPGDDARALRWLARRKFGVFQPMQQRSDRNNPDRKYQGFEPVFPGWLFVFCWNIEKMKHRILNCPGVMDILRDPVTGRPFTVDQPLMANREGTACVWPRVGFIERLQAIGWVYDDRAAPKLRSHASVRAARNAKRSARRLSTSERKTLHQLTADMKLTGAWDAEMWAKANELDPGQRIKLLMATLRSAADDRLPLRA